MTGSIRKRGSSWTAYWWTAESATGKRIQRSKGGFRIKKDAEAFLSLTLGSIELGNWSPDSRITIKDFISQKWIPGLETAEIGGSLRPTTVTFYKGIAKRQIISHIGGVKLNELSATKLNDFYKTLLESGREPEGTGLSATTVLSVHKTVHRMLRDAKKWGLVGRNVADQATPPRSVKFSTIPWTLFETQRFIKETSSDRLGAMWRLFAMTGMRRGELCGLQWDDLDLENDNLRIERTRVVNVGRVITSTPKTNSSSRSIGIDPLTGAALRRHKVNQEVERSMAGESWVDDSGWVFTDQIGRPIDPGKVSKIFSKICRNLGLRKIRLHDLRHGYATAALESGAPLKAVSDRLGHSSIRITADIYSHIRPEIDLEVANLIADKIMSAEAS